MRTHAQARKPVSHLRRAPLPAASPAGPLTTPARVRQILQGPRVQAKLTVGPPGDVYEREADRVADEVMRIPEPEGRVQRVCAECEEEMQRQPAPAKEENEDKMMRAKETPGRVPEVTPDMESRLAALRGGGEPLPSSERAFFEPRFGRDFSDVRIHSGPEAVNLAQQIQARAFTLGDSVVFGSGQYAPGARAGRQLLAHELTHVVQQRGGGTAREASPGFSSTPSEIREKALPVSQVSQSMIQTARDCDQEQIACFRRCWRLKPPWPIDKGSSSHNRYCSALCLAKYMECIGENAIETAFNSMADAMQWLSEHPEVVVGTLVAVAGVTFVVATGGGGALILVLAAL